MADTTGPSSAFTVFEGFVPVHGLAVRPGEEWTGVTPEGEWSAVRCATKKAYGCGVRAPDQQLADGLNLYVRRAAHPELLTSFLSIVLNDEAAASIAADLGFPRTRLEAEADIKIAHRQAIVLLLMFSYHCIPRRAYYLAYDSTDASLRVIPFPPSNLEVIYTLAPAPVRGAGAGVDDLALALMARRVSAPHVPRRHRICVCDCSPAAAQADPGSDGGAWREKVHVFPKLFAPFSAHVVFSLRGKVFWADLSQGVAYSDLVDAGGGSAAAVDTVFVGLPDEHRIEYCPRKDNPPPPNMSRTMGCVEGAIKFICIDSKDDPPSNNETVKVLTLDLDRLMWKEDEGLSCPWNDLWKQVSAMNAELRDLEPLEPLYPTLMPDGVLFLLLPYVPQGGHPHLRGGNYYVCGFDMRSKSLRCFGLVHNYHTLSPLILPSDFFTPVTHAACRS